MKSLTVLKRVALSVVALATLGKAPAFASLITVDLGITQQSTQTDAAGDTSNAGAFFAARAFYQNLGDYDSGTLTYPGGGSPATMSNVPGIFYFLNGGSAAGYFSDQSGTYNSLADLENDFPMGSYTYNLNDSTMANPPATSTLDYTSDLFPANQPIVSAASYNLLQGADSTQDITVNFNQLTNNAAFGGADSAYEFFSVYTADFSSTVYSSYSDTPSITTSFVIPAGTLSPGTGYILAVDFDNRISGTDENSVNQFQLFDTATDVNFSTAAAPVTTPEPSGFLLVAIGLGSIGGIRKALEMWACSSRV